MVQQTGTIVSSPSMIYNTYIRSKQPKPEVHIPPKKPDKIIHPKSRKMTITSFIPAQPSQEPSLCRRQ